MALIKEGAKWPAWICGKLLTGARIIAEPGNCKKTYDPPHKISKTQNKRRKLKESCWSVRLLKSPGNNLVRRALPNCEATDLKISGVERIARWNWRDCECRYMLIIRLSGWQNSLSSSSVHIQTLFTASIAVLIRMYSDGISFTIPFMISFMSIDTKSLVDCA